MTEPNEIKIQPPNEIEPERSTESRQASGEIALCLSGGGYRAAAFHLGVMKSLEDLGMLEHVKFVSTASGGTITAMKYAIDRSTGTSFEEFYLSMCSFLRDVNVVNDGLKVIQKTPTPGGKNNLSLIRCASDIYREELLGKHAGTDKHWTVEELLEGMRTRNTFRDLIFNSSEFRSGNNFRFRLTPGRRLIYGNKNTRIKADIGRQVELADIIAATSCFPAVFEPMRFPEDFHFADRTKVTDPFHTNDFKFKSVSLMDGGILDNQGLYGMTVSYEKPPLPFDLLIVSDTSGRDDVIYDFDLKERGKGTSLGIWLMMILGVLSLLSISSIWALYRTFSGPGTVLDKAAVIVTSLFVLLLTAAAIGGAIWGIGKLKSMTVMGYAFPIWEHIRTLSIADLWTLGKGRIDSVKVMVFSVFMKRIRAMQFDDTMNSVAKKKVKVTDRNPDEVDDEDESEDEDERDENKDTHSCKYLFNGITVFSIIYSIIPNKHGKAAMSFHPTLKPTNRMLEIAGEAQKVGTKLWLTGDELDTLIACGRITICAVLLHYFWRNKRFETLPKPDEEKSEFHFVYQKWKELLNEFSKPAGITKSEVGVTT